MVERKVWIDEAKKQPEYQFDNSVPQIFANNLAEKTDNYIDINQEFGDLTVETFLQKENDDEVYAFCKELWEGGSRRTEVSTHRTDSQAVLMQLLTVLARMLRSRMASWTKTSTTRGSARSAMPS